MQQPHLIIIAGCNGSGKSTYSPMLVEGIIPFDYDKRFLEIYNSLIDSELREKFAENQTTNELNILIEKAFQDKISFAFETNLHVFPFKWIQRAKELNFKIGMYFFCLKDIQLAKKRVDIRVKNNGHFVSDNVIDFKWKEGYKNINLFFSEFNYISFIDNSKKDIPLILFELSRDSNETTFQYIQLVNKLPDYVERRLPNIFNLLD